MSACSIKSINIPVEPPFAAVMAVAVDESLQRALGSAVRALAERIALIEKLH